MSIYSRFFALFDALSAVKGQGALLQLSDRELAARGLSREGLTRSYIAGLGAQ